MFDFTCRTGTLVTMIKHRCPTAEVFGIDADGKGLSLARAKASKNGVVVRLDEDFASELAQANDSFDRVLPSLYLSLFLPNQRKEQYQNSSAFCDRVQGEDCTRPG